MPKYAEGFYAYVTYPTKSRKKSAKKRDLDLYGPFPDPLSAVTAKVSSIPIGELMPMLVPPGFRQSRNIRFEGFKVFRNYTYKWSEGDLADLMENGSEEYEKVRILPKSKLKRHPDWDVDKKDYQILCVTFDYWPTNREKGRYIRPEEFVQRLAEEYETQ